MSLTAGSITAVLPAAGKSRRFGAGDKKIFQLLDDYPVWYHAAAALRRRAEVGPIVIAIDPDDETRWRGSWKPLVESLRIELVPGGAERVDSVRAALAAVAATPYVAIHDAARPLVPADDLLRLFAAVAKSGAALLAAPLRGTIKRQVVVQQTGQPTVLQTVNRDGLWEALTPQIFATEILRSAYQRWRGYPVTDDAQLVERSGHPVTLVVGSPTNLKITVADDLQVARALLAARRDAEPSSL